MSRMSQFFLFLFACVVMSTPVVAQATSPKPSERDAKAPVKERAKAPAAPRDAKSGLTKPPPRRPAPPKSKETGEQLYERLRKLAKAKRTSPSSLLAALHKTGQTIKWKSAAGLAFDGHLRLVKIDEKAKLPYQRSLYMIRGKKGDISLLVLPASVKGQDSPYAGINKATSGKMLFTVKSATASVRGVPYTFVKLVKKPSKKLLDRLFRISIILMLFLVMVGMGLTLTMDDFAMVFKKPKGMLIGPLCQFGLLPLIAFGIGHLFGFAQSYPFIFVGMLLVSTSPGGVTSNLMTYFARGDVALSISLTAFSTVLSVFLTPLLLGVYASGVALKVPVVQVGLQILVLVIVPLIIGLIVRSRAPSFAEASEKFFSFLGVFTLLFLIVVGILANLDKFMDTARYGAAFYGSIFCITFFGMFFGAFLSRILGVENYQTRAIALETGLQNSSLAMIFAILLQDQMGDFHSSMFFTSGIFGLWMYFAGAVMILLFRSWLPITREQEAEAEAAHS